MVMLSKGPDELGKNDKLKWDELSRSDCRDKHLYNLNLLKITGFIALKILIIKFKHSKMI